MNLDEHAAARPAPIPLPEADMTPKRLLERAIALRGVLREQQDEADERGAYSPEIHEAFLKAGFYRVTQPRLFGGYEFELETAYRVIVEISRPPRRRVVPVAAWVTCLCRR